MPAYYAYGLNIQSDLPLPELPGSNGDCDVTIRFGDPNPDPFIKRRSYYWSVLNRREARLSLENVGSFTIVAGREVIVSPALNMRESLLRLILLGPVMGAVLFQRGSLVLHASSVQVQGEAVAFMGATGWGKSSIAAALYARGYPVVADDLTAVPFDNSHVTILPGFARLKISQEVKACLEIDEDLLHSLDPAVQKRSWPVPQDFPQDPVALKCIYLLDENDSLGIEPICSQTAVIELIRHTYPTRFREPGDSDHLKQCAELAKRVRFVRLKRPDDISALPHIARLVEDDLENMRRRYRDD